MKENNFIISIFSNWANLFLTVLIAFAVSPIVVNKLGNETYGIWVLIVSITSFFTILDFGVNSAIVRFISKYKAIDDLKRLREIYSSSFALFAIISLVVILFSAVFAFFFKSIFEIEQFDKAYLYFVFFIVGVDLAINLTFSVLMGSLKGLNRFLEINIISMFILIAKNAILLYLLFNGYSILALAILQVVMTITKYLLQYRLVRTQYPFLKFSPSNVNKETLKLLYDYSIYSFLIAVATKVLFFTDSIVIGSLINVEQITFYTIAGMLVEYLEKFIWAIIAVLIPIISTREAIGDNNKNQELYITGSKYSMLLISPIILVLFTAGDDFIGLWMGKEYAAPSGQVLSVLLIGYVFLLSQLIAHGILKGISKHKVLAFILCAEAIINLSLSVILAPKYGIIGVAIGTTIPLIIANVLLIPMYTCYTLGISYFTFVKKVLFFPLISLFIPILMVSKMDLIISNYFSLALFSIISCLFYLLITILFYLEPTHRNKIYNVFKKA